MPLLFLGKWLLWELSCANESTLIDRCSVPCKGEWVKKREQKRLQLSLKATVHLSSPLKSPLFTLTFPFVRSFPIHYPCFCRVLIVHKVDSIFLSKQRQSQSQSLRPTEFDESVSQSTIFASFSRRNAWLTLPLFGLSTGENKQALSEEVVVVVRAADDQRVMGKMSVSLASAVGPFAHIALD